MAKLPKSLIKKYGITKRAWAEFRKMKGSKRTRTSSSTTRRSKTVAKKRRSTKRKQNNKRDFMSKAVGKLGKPLAAVGYGFVREMISDKIANSALGQKLPVFEFTDEATMLALAFGARKLGAASNPIGAKIINAAEIVEWARIGEGLQDMRAAKKAGSGSSGSGLFA